MLTDKQIQQFVERYKSIYGDTSKDTWTWEIPHIRAEDEEEHRRMWKEKLTEIIWPRNSKKVYKVRAYWPQTILDRVFSELWLCFWPVVDGKKWD